MKKNTRFIRGPINGVSEYKLANGLKVLLMPDHSAPVVTSMVVYRVGSRNEGPGNTGSAHFFEHLMFKGSRRFNPDRGNNLDAVLKQIGAQYNAYTSNDETVYYEQASPEYLELCLAIEADRMRHLRMRKDDRDSEMTVVRNEMEQGENWPQQVMRKQMWATAFTQHPYHHDTIGSRTEVENVPLANMRDFYNTYYWPNNATLIVVGAIDVDTCLKMIEKQFGRLPRSPHRIPKVYTVEPKQEGERRFEIRRAGNMFRLSMAFHVPGATHEDIPALDALSDILGSSWSRSSRLYKRLVETGLASEISASVWPLRDPGLFEIDVDLTEGTATADAEAAVIEEIERLKTEPVSAEELARIKAGHLKDFRLRMAESTYFAYQLAQAESVADWRWLMKKPDAFNAVTAEDVARVATTYMTKTNRTVGVFIPKSDEEASADASPVVEPESVEAKPKKARKADPDPDAVTKTLAQYAGEAPERTSISERIVSCTLDNGLTVNVLNEKPESGVVSVGIAIRAGNYHEGQEKQNLSDVVGSMLPMGSEGLTKQELADQLMELGIQHGMHFNVRPYLSRTSIAVLTEDLETALGLVNTVVRKPVFDEGDLATIKHSWHGRYLQELAHPDSIAQNSLGRQIYEPDHPFYQKSIEGQMADLDSMTVEDLRRFHSQYYTPGNTVVTIVGDIDPGDAIALVESAFSGWTGPAAPGYDVPFVEPVEATRIEKKMPDKPGIAIVLGKVISFKKSDPDYLAAKIGMRILGGDTLTARLGTELRKAGGLTYGVYAGVWDDAFGGCPWFVSLSVNAANVDPAIDKAFEVMQEFIAGGITDRELATEVESMIGGYNLSLTSLSSLAHKISEQVSYGLSLDDIDTVADQLRAITVEDVNRAIRKHFDPADLVTVIAGDF